MFEIIFLPLLFLSIFVQFKIISKQYSKIKRVFLTVLNVLIAPSLTGVIVWIYDNITNPASSASGTSGLLPFAYLILYFIPFCIVAVVVLFIVNMVHDRNNKKKSGRLKNSSTINEQK